MVQRERSMAFLTQATSKLGHGVEGKLKDPNESSIKTMLFVYRAILGIEWVDDPVHYESQCYSHYCFSAGHNGL